MINVLKSFWTNCMSLNRLYQQHLKGNFTTKFFLGRFSMNLRKRLYKSVSKTLPQCNIKVIFQSKNRLSGLFKFKGSIPLNLRSHFIYKFQYSNCNITMAKLNAILKLDLVSIKCVCIIGKRVNNSNKSAIKDHIAFYWFYYLKL